MFWIVIELDCVFNTLGYAKWILKVDHQILIFIFQEKRDQIIDDDV